MHQGYDVMYGAVLIQDRLVGLGLGIDRLGSLLDLFQVTLYTWNFYTLLYSKGTYMYIGLCKVLFSNS